MLCHVDFLDEELHNRTEITSRISVYCGCQHELLLRGMQAAGGDTGVPMGFRGDLALFSVIAFALFLIVLGKLAWKPMIEGLDKRESGIRRAIEEAEENRRKSEALMADYQLKLREAEQTVQSMVAEARRDAERTGKDIVAAAQREVDQIRIRKGRNSPGEGHGTR